MLGSLIRLPLALALLALGLTWRWPMLVELRPLLLAGVPSAAALILALELRGVRRRKGLARVAGWPTAVAAVLALAAAATGEARFRWIRHRVLHADPERLARVGNHLLVGYRDVGEVTGLIQRRAVGGVFVSAWNARGRSAAELAAEVARLQAVRRRAGGAPLWIAADQEGGPVSRLSPPLELLPPVSTLASPCRQPSEQCHEAVTAHARAQGAGLAGLGVNLDLAPVVDLDHHLRNLADRYSRIGTRAVGSDPELVRRVADGYCDALAGEGVACTLKHFPGLGRVFEDTHRRPGMLTASPAELAAADWVPFRAALGHPDRFTMVSHATLLAVDPRRPASTSRAVVQGLLRAQWGSDGPVITDDFSMMALFRSRSGVGRGAVEALGAGVDLVLVSYDPDLVYPILDALLEADRADALDRAALDRSEARLERARRALGR